MSERRPGSRNYRSKKDPKHSPFFLKEPSIGLKNKGGRNEKKLPRQ